MTDQQNVVEGQVVQETTALAKPNGAAADAGDALSAIVTKDADKGVLAAVRALSTLDWKDMKPPEIALLLLQKPFPVSGGGTTFLTLRQAMLFATGCYELGVSPFSNQVWFDAAKGTVNLTFEGKKVVARNRGIDVGPPNYERLERPWPAGTPNPLNHPKDFGYKCKMRVGKPEYNEKAEYMAWYSEWASPHSPVWKAKPDHMLQVRAAEKALTLALGTGASAMPDDAEL